MENLSPIKLIPTTYFDLCTLYICQQWQPSDVKPQEIILSFESFQGNYIKSYPLHKSQWVIIDNEEELWIRLFLIITDDLVKEILSYAERVTVIAPESLIKEIQVRHEDAFKQYQPK